MLFMTAPMDPTDRGKNEQAPVTVEVIAPQRAIASTREYPDIDAKLKITNNSSETLTIVYRCDVRFNLLPFTAVSGAEANVS
jgi:hypothetical protein